MNVTDARRPGALPPLLAALLVAGPATASETYWDYGDEHGPAAWAGLSEDFRTCGEGRAQSPIDLPAAVPVPDFVDSSMLSGFRAASIDVTHQEHTNEIIDNGHTIQVSIYDGNVVDIGDAHYQLKQFHFHAPSEHTLAGRHFPMEIHFVHADETGRLAVAGVLVEEGEHNHAFDNLWAILPHRPGERVTPDVDEVDVHFTGTPGAVFYRYLGSLTTPPCSKGVQWLVRRAPIRMSRQQIETFTAIINRNNRPVQPRNGRPLGIDVPFYE